MAKTTTTQAPEKLLAKKRSKSSLAVGTSDATSTESKISKKAKGKEKEDAKPALVTSTPKKTPGRKSRAVKKTDDNDTGEEDALTEDQAVAGKKGVKQKLETEANVSAKEKKGKVARDVDVSVVNHTAEVAVTESPGAEVVKKKRKGRSPAKEAPQESEDDQPSQVKGKPKSKKGSKDAAVKANTKKEAARPAKSSTVLGAKSKRKTEPTEVQSADEESGYENEDANGSEDEESVHLFDFSTDEDDSSDEDAMDDDEEPGIDIKKLPTVAKDDAVVKKKLDKAKRKPVRSFVLCPYLQLTYEC